MGFTKEQIKQQKQNRLGQTYISKDGQKVTLIEYNTSADIKVQFEDGTIVSGVYGQFAKQSFTNPTLKQNRVGQIAYNSYGDKFTIIKYIDSLNVLVEFDDGTIVNCQYGNFIRGDVKNPNKNYIIGGATRANKYPIKQNGKIVKEYSTWYNMINRCLNDKWKHKYSTYTDATCCAEWLSYDNFYEWCISQDNYLKWKEESRSGLDKDILIKRNKLYSPSTCCLVPSRINSLLIKADKLRGELPVGVYKKQNKYAAALNILGRSKYLGSFDTPEEAFYVYKIAKEAKIKEEAQIAYDNKEITEQCYKALLKYEVEITD